MTNILEQLSLLRTMTMPDLKRRWRELFGTEPPPYNRNYLETRLSYRVQELALGGLSRDTVKRLDALADALDPGNPGKRSLQVDRKPVAGTRLIREWRGVEHCVTVTLDGYEYQGRPYKTLSPIARAISGTPWNGWTFFGLKNAKARS